MQIYNTAKILYTLTFLLLLISSGCSNLSRATPTPAPIATRDPNLEATAVAQLEAMNPDAVQLYRDGSTAMDAGDYETSKELYQQVLNLAPNFATAYRRLGYISLDSNDIDGSIQLLQKAVELEPNGYNQSALAWALNQKNTVLDNQEAFKLASAAAKLLPEDESVISTWLISAALFPDIPTLRQADEKLLQIAPSNPIAHYYAGLLAADDGKWEKAEKELRISQKLGMSEEAVKNALDFGISRNAMIFRLIRWGVIAMGVWFLGLVGLYLTGSILSKATLKALNASKPDLNTQISPRERKIRSIYRMIITVLSLYFYVSIPFVFILLLLVVGVMYGILTIYFVGILLIVLIGSFFKILRSVFSRKKDQIPGRFLSRMDAPELWKLVEDVARMLEIQPVESIQITPDAGIGVYEKGSIIKKMRGKGKRNLLLGMGAIGDLTQGEFAGILAHEYGHFSNRDTAGGNLAYQVYASMNAMAINMIKNGAALFYNPVWLFLIGYQRIFLRVTLGASRLQEVLADRFAAVAYGSENFIDGLKKHIRQSIAFPLQANYEIKNAFAMHRTIVNLYDVPLQDKQETEMLLEFEKAMTRSTSAYDSHPAPKDRISYIEKLNIPYSPIHDNPRPALELFSNPDELQREMTLEITKRLKN